MKTIYNDIAFRLNARNVFLQFYVGKCAILRSNFDEQSGEFSMRLSYRIRDTWSSTKIVSDVVLEPLASGKGFKRKPKSDVTVSMETVNYF